MTNDDITIMLDIIKKFNCRLIGLFSDREFCPKLDFEFYNSNSSFRIRFLGIIIYDTFRDEFNADFDEIEKDLIKEINELLTNLSGKQLCY